MNEHDLHNELDEVKVIDERKKPFFIVDKYVIWNWIPFIGVEGYALYSLYISLVNKEKGFAFPSLNQIARFLKRGKSTVVKYNALLEQYGLIRIERKINPFGSHFANNYYILDVPPVPSELLPELRQISFIKNQDQIEEGWSRTEPGGHVQNQVVTYRTRGGHVQDQGGHVQDSKETKYKETKKERDSLCASEIQIPENSLFTQIPNSTIQKLAATYSADNVLQAVKSLDRTYRNRRKEVRSPLALLKTALKDGFVPVQVQPPSELQPEINVTPETETDEYVQQFELLPDQIKSGWNRFMDELRGQMSSQMFETWFVSLIPTKLADGTLVVATVSPPVAEFIERKWLPQMAAMLKSDEFGFTAIQLHST